MILIKASLLKIGVSHLAQITLDIAPVLLDLYKQLKVYSGFQKLLKLGAGVRADTAEHCTVFTDNYTLVAFSFAEDIRICKA